MRVICLVVALFATMVTVFLWWMAYDILKDRGDSSRWVPGIAEILISIIPTLIAGIFWAFTLGFVTP